MRQHNNFSDIIFILLIMAGFVLTIKWGYDMVVTKRLSPTVFQVDGPKTSVRLVKYKSGCVSLRHQPEPGVWECYERYNKKTPWKIIIADAEILSQRSELL